MRKSLYILYLTGIALFAACSSEDTAIHEQILEDEAVILAKANKNSEVAIRMGSFSYNGVTPTTRSPLHPIGGVFSTPAGQYLGVFCLAQKPQASLGSPGPVDENLIDWTSPSSYLTYLMNPNQPAQVVKLNGSVNVVGSAATTDALSEVRFIDPSTLSTTPTEKHYYYPDGDWYNYYFYAYYPRQATNVSVAAQKVTVGFALDGSQDVLWTKAMPTTNGGAYVDKGFNASYFSNLQIDGVNAITDFPDFGLHHNLALLRFYVRCKDALYASQNYVESDLQVTGLKLLGIPMNWTLTIADRNNEVNEGVMTPTNLILTNELGVWHENADGTDADAFADGAINVPYSANGSEKVYVGYVMIPTTTMMDEAIAAGLTITGRGEESDAEGITRDTRRNPFVKLTVIEKGTEYELNPQKVLLPNGIHATKGEISDYGEFEAGKVYNITLSIPVTGQVPDFGADAQTDPGIATSN